MAVKEILKVYDISSVPKDVLKFHGLEVVGMN